MKLYIYACGYFGILHDIAEMLELKDLLSSKYLKLIHDCNELEVRMSILQADKER